MCRETEKVIRRFDDRSSKLMQLLGRAGKGDIEALCTAIVQCERLASDYGHSDMRMRFGAEHCRFLTGVFQGKADELRRQLEGQQ